MVDEQVRARPRNQRATELIAVDPDRIRTEEHRAAGPAHVGVRFWRKLGLDEILRANGFSERARVLTLAMTMNRLIHPCSEHAMPDWIRRSALSDLIGVDFSKLRDKALLSDNYISPSGKSN